MNSNKYKLSIVMMAYNQADFIAFAIKSVLSQYMPFNWELLIGDDASTDNTEEIVTDFVKQNSNIRYFKNPKNIGLQNNYVSLIKHTKGEYIALLEADDYWLDTNKCFLQVQLMDENLSISWSFTDGEIVKSDGSLIERRSYSNSKLTALDEYVKSFFNPLNNTVIFRKTSEPIIYPEYFFKVRQWDTVLHYLRLLSNNESKPFIGYVPVNGLAWRRHDKATSFQLFSGPERYFDWITLNKQMKQVMPERLRTFFNTNYIAFEYISIAYLQKKKYSLFVFYLFKTILTKPIRGLSEYRDLFWKIRNSRN